ncbi:hypothetical protein KZO85_12150 [Chromohalobacter canadensis]|uniref:hypothetical protein n=1 Tax=Chromohalobacter canadensis TaxID=141389 RepID=UPI0021C002A5|nr:hypothetical protein [Chromohalobacter canadensis]MCT8469336.1 hypothetical protein [Chromohalobacter canadensis]MCT8471960.1 hypothetical protein [Chromohalobacter canadensis]MCT8499927.1 hypothetical protein [Chromohalobacter canadensis]
MTYERRIIGFIDILGFGQLVLDSEDDVEKFDLIKSVLEKINSVDDIYGSPEDFFAYSNYSHLSPTAKQQMDELYESMKAAAGPKRVRITTFSDSIVFSCSADSDGLTDFRYFLTKLLVYTSPFKLLIRGGVTCGSLVHTDEIIFGPAMNNAYYLESKVAKYPRIVVDEKFECFIEELGKDTLTDLVKQELIRTEDETISYIDCLALTTNKVAQNMCGANAYEMLLNEKSTIETLIKDAPEDPKIASKLEWYVEYFNEFITRKAEVEVVVSHVQGMPVETAMIPVSELRVRIP